MQKEGAKAHVEPRGSVFLQISKYSANNVDQNPVADRKKDVTLISLAIHA